MMCNRINNANDYDNNEFEIKSSQFGNEINAEIDRYVSWYESHRNNIFLFSIVYYDLFPSLCLTYESIRTINSTPFIL